MHIRWHEIDHRLRGVDGLDDVLSIDLNFLIRQMQPPMEQQYRHGPVLKTGCTSFAAPTLFWPYLPARQHDPWAGMPAGYGHRPMEALESTRWLCLESTT